jgi:hypothetical protein
MCWKLSWCWLGFNNWWLGREGLQQSVLVLPSFPVCLCFSHQPPAADTLSAQARKGDEDEDCSSIHSFNLPSLTTVLACLLVATQTFVSSPSLSTAPGVNGATNNQPTNQPTKESHSIFPVPVRLRPIPMYQEPLHMH